MTEQSEVRTGEGPNPVRVWNEPPRPKEACSNCGSTMLEWMAVAQGSSAIAVNRLGLGDVTMSFALGCEECSETIRVVSAEAVAYALNTQGVVVREVE
jgi:hypothetical protein